MCSNCVTYIWLTHTPLVVGRSLLQMGISQHTGCFAKAHAPASLDILHGCVMRLLEVTWGWIHYRVVEIWLLCDFRLSI